LPTHEPAAGIVVGVICLRSKKIKKHTAHQLADQA